MNYFGMLWRQQGKLLPSFLVSSCLTQEGQTPHAGLIFQNNLA
jgi:hypothetical protein